MNKFFKFMGWTNSYGKVNYDEIGWDILFVTVVALGYLAIKFGMAYHGN